MHLVLITGEEKARQSLGAWTSHLALPSSGQSWLLVRPGGQVWGGGGWGVAGRKQSPEEPPQFSKPPDPSPWLCQAGFRPKQHGGLEVPGLLEKVKFRVAAPQS